MESIYPPPSQFAANAFIKSPEEYRVLYEQSVSEPEKFWAQVAERFRVEIDPHFRIEEEHLLPALTQAGESDLVARTARDHVELRSLIERDAAPETVLRFGERLDAHVRFEERELFPRAEAVLPAEALDAIDVAARAR